MNVQSKRKKGIDLMMNDVNNLAERRKEFCI